MMRPEATLQRTIKRFLETHGYRAVACSNGAVLAGGPKQRAIQMNTLKSMGLLPGFPDLIVYGPEGRIGHLEVKLEGEKADKRQVECHEWMNDWGHKVAVVRSLEDVAETLLGWGWQ